MIRTEKYTIMLDEYTYLNYEFINLFEIKFITRIDKPILILESYYYAKAVLDGLKICYEKELNSFNININELILVNINELKSCDYCNNIYLKEASDYLDFCQPCGKLSGF